SPGTAVSTVPDYVGGDRYNGTSMSSPYTAGCAAVLLSAMTQAFPDWKPNAYTIKRAMMLSASHIEGATPLDEGMGMIDVPAAFELLSRFGFRVPGEAIPIPEPPGSPLNRRVNPIPDLLASNYSTPSSSHTRSTIRIITTLH